jgi:hypothetical protein
VGARLTAQSATCMYPFVQAAAAGTCSLRCHTCWA